MAIANVALTDTFDTQRTRLNQAIARGNIDEITIPAAFGQANTNAISVASAYNRANIANATSVSSFALANSTNTTVVNQTVTLSSAYNRANIANTTAIASFVQSNTTLSTAQGSFAQANIALGTAQGAFDLANNINTSTQILTDAASVSWDVTIGKVATLNLTSGVGVTRNIANPTGTRSGEIYILHIVQEDSTARSIQAWGSAFKWTAATKPPSSSGSGTRDIYSFICDGTSLYGSFIPDVR